jgi:hypothetical protein
MPAKKGSKIKKTLTAKVMKKVKGGLSDFTITRRTDKASTSL